MLKKPLAVGLKVCEKAVAESKTGNVTLMNCLRRLSVKKGFPAHVPSLFAFVSITDAQGVCQMRVAVNHLEMMDEIIAQEWETDFSKPLREDWFLVPIGPLEFPVAGRYEVALFAEGEMITRSVIDVTGAVT